MIKLIDVVNNPYRDFKLDPINPETVQKMEDSIEELGFWGGLAVRKAGTKYQLAFGHHRLEALRKLGWDKADLNVVKYDEDQMVRAMVVENATQRGAEGSAALDSVGGIIKRIGYLLLTESDEGIAAQKFLGSESTVQSRAKAREQFLAGNGIGEDDVTVARVATR